MNRQRLDAEALRDSLLAVSGELLASAEGPGLPLEYPENSNSLEPQAVNPPAFALRKFRPSQEFERTVYLPVIRVAQEGTGQVPRRVRLHTARPDGGAAVSDRRGDAGSVPPQQRPRPRTGRGPGEAAHFGIARHRAALRELWLRGLNRPITPAEAEDAAAFLATLTPLLKDRRDAELAAWTELCHAVLSSNEFLHRL